MATDKQPMLESFRTLRTERPDAMAAYRQRLEQVVHFEARLRRFVPQMRSKVRNTL